MAHARDPPRGGRKKRVGGPDRRSTSLYSVFLRSRTIHPLGLIHIKNSLANIYIRRFPRDFCPSPLLLLSPIRARGSFSPTDPHSRGLGALTTNPLTGYDTRPDRAASTRRAEIAGGTAARRHPGGEKKRERGREEEKKRESARLSVPHGDRVCGVVAARPTGFGARGAAPLHPRSGTAR